MHNCDIQTVLLIQLHHCGLVKGLVEDALRGGHDQSDGLGLGTGQELVAVIGHHLGVGGSPPAPHPVAGLGVRLLTAGHQTRVPGQVRVVGHDKLLHVEDHPAHQRVLGVTS